MGMRFSLFTVLFAVALIAGKTPDANARGLLGLFADSDRHDTGNITPENPPAPGPASANVVQAGPDFVAFVANLRQAADPRIELYTFVKSGSELDLGPDGEITLTFLNPCHQEVAIGGTIEIRETDIRGYDSRLQSHASSCRPVEEFLPTPNSLIAVEDNEPFNANNWREIILPGSQPIFKWPYPVAGDVVLVQLIDLDLAVPAVIWEIETPFVSAIYPTDAARLIDGHPYMAVVRRPGRPTLAETFSIDRRIAYTNTPLNTVVMIKAPMNEDTP